MHNIKSATDFLVSLISFIWFYLIYSIIMKTTQGRCWFFERTFEICCCWNIGCQRHCVGSDWHWKRFVFKIYLFYICIVFVNVHNKWLFSFLFFVTVDTVVVGSRGHGAIKRALLGSLSTYLAHHANANVIITRKKQSK